MSIFEMNFFLIIFGVLGLCGYGLARAKNEKFIHPQFRSVLPSEILNAEELSSEYWNEKAQSVIAKKIENSKEPNKKTAKNIIMFLGDGMSVHTVTATRSFIQDPSYQISFEKFPYFGLSKTFCVNKQVPDSACTATAYLTGVKGNYGTIGVNAEVERYDCYKASNKSTHTTSIAKWAQDAGKATGVVTTTRVTHASPSGNYAHTANRDWERDFQKQSNGCTTDENPDIADQLVNGEVGKALKVVLGGGRREFRNATVNDEEGKPGYRRDGRDLINEWLKNHDTFKRSYVWSRKGLQSLDFDNTDYLLGLFQSDHCLYNGDIKRQHLELAEPTLTEMTEAAIKILQKEKNGFYLFVEGGRIDLAHHDAFARKALEETEEFGKAIQRARDLTSEDDTLIVVTSDHSHTMTVNGYPLRGTDILGLSGGNGDDGLPYSSLSYANGPGYYKAFDSNGRRDISKDEFNDPRYTYMATVPLGVESHGGDDVGVFASGPQAHIFSGNYEQTNIPMLMAHAAQIGPYSTKK